MIDSRLTWLGIALGALGFLATVVLGLPSVLPYFRDSNITVRILQNFDVVEFRASIPELKLFFGDEEISKSGKNLRILRARIENESGYHVREVDYDSQVGWGIRVAGAELRSVGQIQASSNYLIERARGAKKTNESLHLPPLIFDDGEWLEFDLLLMGNTDANPVLGVFGKISGVESIEFVKEVEPKSDSLSQPIFAIAFSSSLMLLFSGVKTMLVRRRRVDGRPGDI